MKKTNNNKAYLLAEAFVALGILGVMLVVFSRLAASSNMVSNRMFARQACMAAALGQLESIDNTGELISGEQVIELWPRVEIRVEEEAGADKWQGLTKYTVTARFKGSDPQIESVQSRYICAKPSDRDGGIENEQN